MNLGTLVGNLVGQVLSNPIVVTGATILAGSLVAGWLLATVWAFHDASHRSESVIARYLAAAWVFLSGPVLLPLSLPIYAAVRPPDTRADRRVHRLIEAIRAQAEDRTCADCGAPMEPAWIRCPRCAAWAGRQCQRCERWAPREADICPWCTWAPGERLEAPAVLVPALSAELPHSGAVLGQPASIPIADTVGAGATQPPAVRDLDWAPIPLAVEPPAAAQEAGELVPLAAPSLAPATLAAVPLASVPLTTAAIAGQSATAVPGVRPEAVFPMPLAAAPLAFPTGARTTAATPPAISDAGGPIDLHTASLMRSGIGDRAYTAAAAAARRARATSHHRGHETAPVPQETGAGVASPAAGATGRQD